MTLKVYKFLHLSSNSLHIYIVLDIKILGNYRLNWKEIIVKYWYWFPNHSFCNYNRSSYLIFGYRLNSSQKHTTIVIIQIHTAAMLIYLSQHELEIILFNLLILSKILIKFKISHCLTVPMWQTNLVVAMI